MSRTRPAARLLLCLLGWLAAAPLAPAQVKYPPRPEKVDVQIWYRISRERNERVLQFRALKAYLDKLGYVDSPREDIDLEITNPNAERFYGTMPSANVFQVLDDPHVRAIQFAPPGFAPADKPVPVRLGLVTGFLPRDQAALHRQVVGQLRRMGFREAIGYDTAGNTLVRGDIPPATFPRLMKDLRTQPAGWFLADTPPDQLPSPLRDVQPVRWVEVLPDADLNFLTPPAPDALRPTLSPELRSLLDDKEAARGPVRVEVILDAPPDLRQLEQIRTRLRGEYAAVVKDPDTGISLTAAPSLDGVVGNVLSIRLLRAEDAAQFAAEPRVIGVRLARAAHETAIPMPKSRAPQAPSEVLDATRVDRLHKMGYRGRGARVVVIASDFPGVPELIAKTLLPPDTRVIDLTTELSPTFEPYPSAKPAERGKDGEPRTAGPPGSEFPGTATALTVNLTAPDARLVLVRVDPAALFQVNTVARAVTGVPGYSEAMQSRIAELSARAEEFRRLNLLALEEYRQAFQNLSDEEKPRLRREAALKNLELIRTGLQKVTAHIARFEGLHEAVRGLAGANVVVNTLVWESGYPVDGLSTLSQGIDLAFAGEALPVPVTRSATRPRFVPRPVWVQASSGLGGSVWGGPHLDTDATGAMEFSPGRPDPGFATVAGGLSDALADPPGGWSRELNFLAVRDPLGKTTPTLPAKARVRLVVQWREPRDQAVFAGRESTFSLTLRVFRQLDPTGTKRASDELEEVARSGGTPAEIRVTPSYGVYEQVLEFEVPVDGRYCVRIDGARSEAVLPALQRRVEIAPRLVVGFVGGGSDRVVFDTFAPRETGVGIPGDAKAALTVEDGQPGQGQILGGPGITLLAKPDLYADGAIVGIGASGSAIAAGFVAGMVADILGAGVPPADILRAIGLPTGSRAVVPEGWLRIIPPRPGFPLR